MGQTHGRGPQAYARLPAFAHLCPSATRGGGGRPDSGRFHVPTAGLTRLLAAVLARDVTGSETPSGQKATSGVFFGVSRMVGLINQANTRLQTTLNSSATGGSTKSMQSRNSQDVDREGQVVVEMFENERLEGKLQAGDPKKFSDRDAAAGSGHDALPEGELPPGYEWSTDWEIDLNFNSVDRDGTLLASTMCGDVISSSARSDA
jgi:hypothetical protein